MLRHDVGYTQGTRNASDGSLKRPRKRSECFEIMRPCPFVTCDFNLFPEWAGLRGRSKRSGCKKRIIRTKITDPFKVPQNRSCVLDIALLGGLTLEEVGYILDITRERVRQIQFAALKKMAYHYRLKKYLNVGISEASSLYRLDESPVTISDLECLSLAGI